VTTRLDADTPEGRSMSSRYGVNGFPTLLVVDATGRELKRIVGFRDANALAAELRGL
jgi:thiol:disulfide interchange protein